MRGSGAAAQKGIKSFRTQDFRSSFPPSVCPERANLKPVRVDWWPEMDNLRTERANLRPEIVDSMPES